MLAMQAARTGNECRTDPCRRHASPRSAGRTKASAPTCAFHRCRGHVEWWAVTQNLLILSTLYSALSSWTAQSEINDCKTCSPGRIRPGLCAKRAMQAARTGNECRTDPCRRHASLRSAGRTKASAPTCALHRCRLSLTMCLAGSAHDGTI